MPATHAVVTDSVSSSHSVSSCTVTHTVLATVVGSTRTVHPSTKTVTVKLTGCAGCTVKTTQASRNNPVVSTITATAGYDTATHFVCAGPVTTT